jgi:hypothetical protein
MNPDPSQEPRGWLSDDDDDVDVDGETKGKQLTSRLVSQHTPSSRYTLLIEPYSYLRPWFPDKSPLIPTFIVTKFINIIPLLPLTRPSRLLQLLLTLVTDLNCLSE